MQKSPIISATGVKKVFQSAATQVTALSNASLDLYPGSAVALKGRSGSGKSTLLNLMGGLDIATEGTILIDGKDASKMTPDEKAQLRRHTIGFVFQSFSLLPLFTAYENVELPLLIAGVPAGKREARTMECLGMVGVAHRAKHRAFELSGGEQQRISIARAIANDPRVILADEPTAELDSVNSLAVFSILKNLAEKQGKAVLVATHDELVHELNFEVHEIVDGMLVSEASRQKLR